MTHPSITIGALFVPADLRARQRQVIARAVAAARRDLDMAKDRHAAATQALLTTFETRARAIHAADGLTTDQKASHLAALTVAYLRQAIAADQAYSNAYTYLIGVITEFGGVLPPEPAVLVEPEAAVA